MQEEEARPQEDQVQQANKAKEERHVDAVLVADASLHDGDVQPVHNGAEEGHAVADGDAGLALVREVAPVLVALPGQVDAGDEDDAGQRGQHAGQLARAEGLDAHGGAEDERPHRRRRRQDRHGPDRGVLEARRGEVVGTEPEHAELEAQEARLAEGQLFGWGSLEARRVLDLHRAGGAVGPRAASASLLCVSVDIFVVVVVIFGPATEQAVLLVIGCLEHRGLPEERVAPRPPALLVFPALLINPQLHQLRPYPLHAMAPVVPHKQRYQTDGEDRGVDVHDKEGLVVGVVREDVAG